MSHKPEPVIDEEGFPNFLFEGCHCAGCQILRFQYDSYKIEAIARLARKISEVTDDIEFGAAHDDRICREAVAGWKRQRRELGSGLKTALERWTPATGVTWQ